MLFLKSLTSFLGISTVHILQSGHWQTSVCYWMGCEKALEKRVILTWILLHVFVVFCSSLYFSPCKEIQYLVLKDSSCAHGDANHRLRRILQKTHKWLWPTQWLLWASTLALDFFISKLLLHEKNKTNWFKLLFLFFFSYLTFFFFFLLVGGFCCTQLDDFYNPFTWSLVRFYNCYRSGYNLLMLLIVRYGSPNSFFIFLIKHWVTLVSKII